MDLLQLYMQEIQKFPVLSDQEVNELFKKANKGDANAKQKIIESHLRLVVPFAQKYHYPGVDILDLIEEGNLGLMHAVKKFDLRKKVRFPTYAAYWIEQAIKRAASDQTHLIHIPLHTWELLHKITREWTNLQKKLKHHPTLSELAKKLHLPLEKVRNVLDLVGVFQKMSSLDQPLQPEEKARLEDLISDKKTISPEEVLSNIKTREELLQALNSLSKKEREIIGFHFGLAKKQHQSLEEIGKKLKISRERVRQLEKRALEKLRVYIKLKGLLGFPKKKKGEENEKSEELHS